jgi:hypothetical protein
MTDDDTIFPSFVPTILIVAVAIIFYCCRSIVPDSIGVRKKKFLSVLLTVATITLLIAGLVSFCISMTSYLKDIPVICTTSETKIKSLSLGSKYSGSFVLGFGSLSSTDYYYVYVENGEGWLLRKFYADRWSLVEKDETPRLKTTTCDSGSMRVNQTLEIIVPSQTILEKYEADLSEIK